MSALVDYSDARPGGATLARAGIVGVCRYLAYSHPSAEAERKFLTGPEVADLHDHGLAIVANFESTADRAATAGPAGGTADGTDARVAMSALGFPVGRTCYVTVQDTGLTTSQFPAIVGYLAAFTTALAGKYRVGIYGGSVLRGYLAAHGFPAIPFWQSGALSWSGGRWDPTATIQQRGAASPVLAGVNVDYDTALVADYGAWAAPTLPETSTEDLMPIYTLGGMRVGTVAAGTPYYASSGDSAPRGKTGATARYLLIAVNETNSRVCLDGLYAGPTTATPVLAGWVPLSAVTDITPVVRPYHVGIEISGASAAPVATVTQS